MPLVYYLLLFSCFFSPSLYGVVFGLSSDGETLLSLTRYWASVPPPISSSWNASDSSPCSSSWVGVVCDRTGLRVVGLNLSGYDISGQIGPEIANLSSLKSIDLSSNKLSGKIPETLGDLHNLTTINLSSNSLNGSVPEFLFRIPNLQTLYLTSNKLTGLIPPSIGNLTNVISLGLDDNQLSGPIPSSIANCSLLQVLYLNDNQLTGLLPESLNHLVDLNFLDVHSNSLEGRIPLGSSGSCKALVYLDLSFNNLSTVLPPELANCSNLGEFAAVDCNLRGPIPYSFGHFTNLTLLHLSENGLSGRIPPELGMCTNLDDLQLDANQLEGDIPGELGNLSQLEYLYLFGNLLTGEVPMGIWRIQSLVELLIYDNNLSGELPVEITELKQLRQFTMQNCRFSGVIPQGLGINSSFTLLDFTNNSFTGQIPPNLCFGKQLEKLTMGFNNLEGSVPSDIGNCISLQRLILQHNNLTGVLPEFKENSNMSYMNLRGNSFSGEVPASYGHFANITFIDLSMNRLSGLVPQELGYLMTLGALDLSHNNLEGPLPTELSNYTRMTVFDVSHNRLNGSVPPSLGTLTKLNTLDLSENKFSGSIPPLSELLALVNLQLGGNSFVGNIPSSIATLQTLTALNLSNNQLTGGIPADIGRAIMLDSLDVSQNNLSGTLNPLANIVNLTYLNISYNFFTGPIPEKLLKFLNSSSPSFMGNPGLCLSCGSNCVYSNTVRSCDFQSGNQKRLNRVQSAMIALGSSIFVVVILLGLYLMVFRCKRQKQEHEVFNEEGGSLLLKKVLDATENLNEKYIIGRGAHGTVYKAFLGRDGAYAVKKLVYGQTKEGSTSMVREIQTVGKVRHRNLVKLEDFWLRKDYGLILYRYMENGSLHDILHEIYPPPTLEWSTRYRIALGTAHGLAYLHFDCDPPIIHRDIKPMNILLDADMEPHISDFGLAKILDQSSTTLPVTNILRGTIGYIAPENAFTTTRSKESDVYSYGVVLLELISRKKALDPSFMEGMDIVGWVRSIWSKTEEIELIIDPSLWDELFDYSIREEVNEVLSVALRCTEMEPSRRPSMREVVKRLEATNAASASMRR